MLRERKFAIAFLGWMLFVTYSSLATFPETEASRINIPNLDKVVHFTFYFVAVILAVFSIREMTKGNFPLKKALLISVIGAIFFGIIIEVVQYSFTTDRHGDVFDALANSFGALVGGWVMKSFFWKQRRLKWKN